MFFVVSPGVAQECSAAGRTGEEWTSSQSPLRPGETWGMFSTHRDVEWQSPGEDAEVGYQGNMSTTVYPSITNQSIFEIQNLTID